MLRVVNETHQTLKKNIGLQRIKYGENYMKSPYLREIYHDDGLLVYNVLTCEIILIDKELYYNPDANLKRWLIERWYYLEETNNYRQIADMFRQAATHNEAYHKEKQETAGFVITTTTVCNARCFYCYESGYHQKPMTDEMAKNIAKYIVSLGQKKIHITWFGGEPLCNPSAIRIISKHLKDSGIQLMSSMITNGYLINEFTAEEMKSDWNIQSIQITIDGTKDIYQKVKNYKNNDDNAYERIFENVEYLLSNDIRVSIRMNIGLHNGEDIIDLIQQLYNRFNKYPKFWAYAAELFIGEGDPPLILTEEETFKLFTNTKNACAKLKELGVKQRPFNVPIKEYKAFHCMADSGNSRLISIDGNITPCEHYAFSEICGNIYDGITDYELLNTWKERLYKPECDSCYNYPKCLKIKKCATDNLCDLPQRTLMDYHVESSVLDIYENYKTKTVL